MTRIRKFSNIHCRRCQNRRIMKPNRRFSCNFCRAHLDLMQRRQEIVIDILRLFGISQRPQLVENLLQNLHAGCRIGQRNTWRRALRNYRNFSVRSQRRRNLQIMEHDFEESMAQQIEVYLRNWQPFRQTDGQQRRRPRNAMPRSAATDPITYRRNNRRSQRIRLRWFPRRSAATVAARRATQPNILIYILIAMDNSIRSLRGQTQVRIYVMIYLESIFFGLFYLFL
ncbi:Hypothetical predicted protein [Cloeon dipterum]|uniref:Uncharacterized protein n=1 Tax=Cloeon dipterum TaxID=197152 RepID=A0A8S1DK86_9INSE|nr:Hypothetical predicted protein [Cloeon dipterum]